MGVDVILLSGSNMGDSPALLSRAVELLRGEAGRVVSTSQVLVSEPWGFGERSGDVARFYNQAIRLHTELGAEELLDVIQRVEQLVGRERGAEQAERERSGGRYASRVIDIDIIFYGDRVIDSERLRVPHPLMMEREFVLRPMVEVAGEWRHPLDGRSCEELLRSLNNR